jgi:hypothetical protein
MDDPNGLSGLREIPLPWPRQNDSTGDPILVTVNLLLLAADTLESVSKKLDRTSGRKTGVL